MKIFLIIILTTVRIWILPCAGQAEESSQLNPERAFYRANMYYETGNYDKAIKEDESILENGLKSGNLYYNLGNAYFKKGELGKAILNYERARRFIPRDSDLLSNYRHAKSLMKRKDAPEKRMRIFKWLDTVMAYLTLSQSVALVLVLYYMIVAFIIITKVFGKFRNHSTAFIILFCFVLTAMLDPVFFKIRDLRQAGIVTSTITDARFEPLKDATVHFPLYEGMKVYVLRKKEQWYKIKRPDGKIGWINKNTTGLISE